MSSSLPECAPRHRAGRALLAVALAGALAVTHAATGGWKAVTHAATGGWKAVTHADDPWQAAAPGTQPYQATDSVLQILDSAASALLLGYASAQTANELILTATGSVSDNDSRNGNNKNGNGLNGPVEIATFRSGDSLYAAVAPNEDDSVQILNITDPYGIAMTGNIKDVADTDLEGPLDIDTFQLVSGIYAAVTSYDSNSVQILDITNPSSVIATGSITNTTGTLLGGACNIAVYNMSEFDCYAVATANVDNGVQILSAANPANIWEQ